jgi:hypothetical protein
VIRFTDLGRNPKMPATEQELGDLHKHVANALSEQVQGVVVEEVGLDGEKSQRKLHPSPALLGAAIAFLKNNNITASASDNAALKELQEKLAQRRNRKITPEAFDEAAANYAMSVGGGAGYRQ